MECEETRDGMRFDVYWDDLTPLAQKQFKNAIEEGTGFFPDGFYVHPLFSDEFLWEEVI